MNEDVTYAENYDRLLTVYRGNWWIRHKDLIGFITGGLAVSMYSISIWFTIGIGIIVGVVAGVLNVISEMPSEFRAVREE